MLKQLRWSHWPLLGEGQLTLEKGLYSLSGDSGSGKSLFLEMLAFLFGGPTPRGHLEHPGEVTGEIIAPTGENIVIKRLWRKKSNPLYIQDKLANKSEREQLFSSIYQHQQHAHLKLLHASYLRDKLDDFGGLQALKTQVSAAFLTYQSLDQQLKNYQVEQIAQEIDYLRFQCEELAHLPTAPALQEALSQHEAMGRIGDAHSQIQNLLEQWPDLSSTLHALATLKQPSLEPILAQLEAAQLEWDDGTRALNHWLTRHENDEAQYDRLDATIQQWHHLARKHRVHITDLPHTAEKLSKRLTHLESLDLEGLHAAHAKAWKDFMDKAHALREARIKKVSPMITQWQKQLAGLGLPNAQLQLPFEEATPSVEGIDTLSLLFSARAELAPAPLSRTASGGELSRLALALHFVLIEQLKHPPIVLLDEVDTGISGLATEQLARTLQQLGHHTQLFCASHSAQLVAGSHYPLLVQSPEQEHRIVLMDESTRIEELSRLLSGQKTDQTSQALANQLRARWAVGGSVGI